MRELLVLAGERSSTVSCGDVAVWDRLDVPEGQISVPGALHARLRDIRGELVAWVFDLGRLSVDGVAVQERLKAGDDLSMWWCSLLFEKHPKVTPDLWSALKLRALELLVEEGGKAALLAGCGHLGIVNTLREAERRLGRRPDVVFGGFHLFELKPGAPEAEALLRATAEELLQGSTIYYTGHCTGDWAYARLQETLGDRLRPMDCGASAEL